MDNPTDPERQKCEDCGRIISDDAVDGPWYDADPASFCVLETVREIGVVPEVELRAMVECQQRTIRRIADRDRGQYPPLLLEGEHSVCGGCGALLGPSHVWAVCAAELRSRLATAEQANADLRQDLDDARNGWESSAEALRDADDALAAAEQARESLIGGMRVAASEWHAERQKRFRAEVDLTAAQQRIAELEPMREMVVAIGNLSFQARVSSSIQVQQLLERFDELFRQAGIQPWPPYRGAPQPPAAQCVQCGYAGAGVIDTRCLNCRRTADRIARHAAQADSVGAGGGECPECKGARRVDQEGLNGVCTLVCQACRGTGRLQLYAPDEVCEHLVNRTATDCSLCDDAEADSVGAGEPCCKQFIEECQADCVLPLHHGGLHSAAQPGAPSSEREE